MFYIVQEGRLTLGNLLAVMDDATNVHHAKAEIDPSAMVSKAVNRPVRVRMHKLQQFWFPRH